VSYSFIDYKGFPIVSPQPTGEPASQFNTAFSGVAEHIDDTTNPHQVTAAQVGAQSYGSYHRDITFVLGDVLEVGADQTNHVPLTASGYFQSLYAIVKSAPAGDDIVFGVNKNGVAIQSSKIIIPDGNTSGSSTDFSVSTFLVGDYLSIDIDQVGSATAGSDATVVLGMECM
jgi:hypothetical protein